MSFNFLSSSKSHISNLSFRFIGYIWKIDLDLREKFEIVFQMISYKSMFNQK